MPINPSYQKTYELDLLAEKSRKMMEIIYFGIQLESILL